MSFALTGDGAAITVKVVGTDSWGQKWYGTFYVNRSEFSSTVRAWAHRMAVVDWYVLEGK